jgi:hypothetical protein
MCIHTHTYIHTYTRTYTRIYIHTHVHTYIRTYTRTYIHTYTRIYIHTYIHTYVHTYIHTYTHTHIHKYIRTYIHTYINTHTYIHIYLHTHTHTNVLRFGNVTDWLAGFCFTLEVTKSLACLCVTCRLRRSPSVFNVSVVYPASNTNNLLHAKRIFTQYTHVAQKKKHYYKSERTSDCRWLAHEYTWRWKSKSVKNSPPAIRVSRFAYVFSPPNHPIIKTCNESCARFFVYNHKLQRSEHMKHIEIRLSRVVSVSANSSHGIDDKC